MAATTLQLRRCCGCRPHLLRRALSSSPSAAASTQQHGLFINNAHVPSQTDSERVALYSPATREPLGHSITLADAKDVDMAVRAAYDSFEGGGWSRKADVRERSKVLLNMAQGLEARLPELARLESLQTGRPLREMQAQLARLPEWLEYFSALLRTHEGTCPPFVGSYVNYVRRVPLGVCGLISPWNHPLLIALKKMAPAIAAGNSVVLKPSELAPLAVLALGDIAADAGLPPGVLNILPGHGNVAGRALASHPRVRKVDLTGGTATGRVTACNAGKNLASVVAELGGKAPMLVFEDADLEQAVNTCAFAAFVAAGQTCVSGSRLLVQESVFDNFKARFVAKAGSLKLGDPLDLDTDMGPLISAAQLERVNGFVQRAKQQGAKVLCGGGPPAPGVLPEALAHGFYFQPTVVGDVHPQTEIVREEVFGPVVCILPFKDEADAVRLANDSIYGLGASVHTIDVKRAHRVAHQLQAGMCWVNDHHRNAPSSPWGGVTAASGLGRENGIEALHEYTQSKSVIVGYGEEKFDWYAQRNARYS